MVGPLGEDVGVCARGTGIWGGRGWVESGVGRGEGLEIAKKGISKEVVGVEGD